MNRYIMTLIFSFLIIHSFYAQIKKQFTFLDSTNLFMKVDSLKADEHTEFCLTRFLVITNEEIKINNIINEIVSGKENNEHILIRSNQTYYPKTEFINDGTDKKYDKTFVWYSKIEHLTFIYILGYF